MSLEIQKVEVSRENVPVVHGVSLTINPGEVHVIMGPNGSGKSTLANALLGSPECATTAGSITLDGQELTTLPTHERAKAGLFLSPQYPPEIAGVSITNFLRLAYNAVAQTPLNAVAFYTLLREKMGELGIDPSFAQRSLNVGFSGGEKKRAEILQLAVLNPKYAILDETDSGLDVDSLKIVAQGINRFRSTEKGVLIITHYQRLLEYVTPDFVHIMKEGQIVKSGGAELAKQIESEGYENL